MKLEDQVAPLYLAVRMKDLGFPQDTELVWVMAEDPETANVQVRWLAIENGVEIDVAAPTVAEMGEWLPEKYYSYRTELPPPARPMWMACNAQLESIDFEAYSEAEVRALTLIRLAELHALNPRETAGPS